MNGLRGASIANRGCQTHGLELETHKMRLKANNKGRVSPRGAALVEYAVDMPRPICEAHSQGVKMGQEPDQQVNNED